MNKYDLILYYVILSKTHLSIWYNSLIRKVLSTRRITMVNKSDTKPKAIFARYLLFKFLTYIITALKNIRNKLDVQAEKMEVLKDSDDGHETIIIDSRMVGNDIKEYITIKDVVNYIEKNNSNAEGNLSTPVTKVFIKFELHDNNIDSKPICLKKYLTKYRDLHENNHHTLDNIIHFNCHEITMPSDNSKVKMTYMSKGKIVTQELLYKEVCDEHINYFHKLD